MKIQFGSHYAEKELTFFFKNVWVFYEIDHNHIGISSNLAPAGETWTISHILTEKINYIFNSQYACVFGECYETTKNKLEYGNFYIPDNPITVDYEATEIKHTAFCSSLVQS